MSKIPLQKKPLQVPVFFPSASRVKIPFVGDDTRQVKITTAGLYPVANPLRRHQSNIENSVIKEISKDVNFETEVIKERSAHTLPYDVEEVLKVYDYSDIITTFPSFSGQLGGRFDVQGCTRKAVGHFKNRSSPRFTKRRSKLVTPTERHGSIAPISDNEADHDNIAKRTLKYSGGTFLTESAFLNPKSSKATSTIYYMTASSAGSQKGKRKSPPLWDEYVLNQLSKDTARWIVFDNTETGLQKDRLDRLLRNKFGEKISNTHLVREDGEDNNIKAIEQKKIQKQKKLMEEKKIARKQKRISGIQNDSLFRQTCAQYYKLPRFLNQERSKMVPVSDDVNQTAQNLKMKHLEPPPPPKLKDFLNPAAGKFINATENAFEQQLYTNQAKPVFQRNGDKSRIIMDDLSEYQSSMQTVYPPLHEQWSDNEERRREKKKTKVKSAKIVRGLQRWKELPNPADFASERGLNPPTNESEKREMLDISKSATMLDNAPMIHIIEEWRSKWKLAGNWSDVTLADIILDLESIHDHVRLGAVAACAMAALHKMPVADLAVLAVLPKIDSTAASDRNAGHLPKALLAKVQSCLHDSHSRVRLAAAMCLYTLSDSRDEILEILEYNLLNGVPTDKLACAQCLALHGSTDAKVLHLLIQMLLESDEEQQATALLVQASKYTRLVHSLLGEQLNSSNWKDKVIACKVLSQLSGNINRDLVHKLSNLMWEDWSSEVRKAASQALGRTGHGRDVHYELRDKLRTGNERVCVDVLRKIAHLGIMTATLLPEYIKCFSAEYVSVRLESCRTAISLQITEEKIILELIHLTQYDPAWKIKAYAIKALGVIGVFKEKIQSVLVWALRFEDVPGVRMEACVSLRKLNCNAPEVILVLQDRVLVEPDLPVKDEVRKTLIAFGMSGPEDNMEMIRQIKSEVKRLCKKSVVAAKIMMYERELDKFERKAQYIGNALDELSSDDETNCDDQEPEIENLLRSSKSADEKREASLAPSCDITVTPLDPPRTQDTSREQVNSINEQALMIPRKGRSQSLTP